MKPNAAQILLLIREGTVYDWASLCASFGEMPAAHHTGTYILAKILEDLSAAGLAWIPILAF